MALVQLLAPAYSCKAIKALSFSTEAGHTETIVNVIADEAGSGGGDVGATGHGGLIINGLGTVVLAGASTFTGVVNVNHGTLELGDNAGAGSGVIAFGTNASATLKLDTSIDPSNVISGFDVTNKNDFAALTFVPGGQMVLQSTSGGVQTWALEDSGNMVLVTLNLTGTYRATAAQFTIASDGASGTAITTTFDITPLTLAITSAGGLTNTPTQTVIP